MKRSKFILILASTALIGAAAPTLAGSLQSAPPQRVPSTTQDAVRETSASVNLSATGGRGNGLDRFPPPGSWVLSAETTLVNFGPATYTRCQIFAGGAQIASGAVTIGDQRFQEQTRRPPLSLDEDCSAQWRAASTSEQG